MTQPSEGQRRQEMLFELEELKKQCYEAIIPNAGVVVLRLIDILKKGL